MSAVARVDKMCQMYILGRCSEVLNIRDIITKGNASVDYKEMCSQHPMKAVLDSLKVFETKSKLRAHLDIASKMPSSKLH